jgi:hypothetical protein
MQIKLRVSKFPITCSSSKRKLKKRRKDTEVLPSNKFAWHPLQTFQKKLFKQRETGRRIEREKKRMFE